jgi:hypothetical protein
VSEHRITSESWDGRAYRVRCSCGKSVEVKAPGAYVFALVEGHKQLRARHEERCNGRNCEGHTLCEPPDEAEGSEE